MLEEWLLLVSIRYRILMFSMYLSFVAMCVIRMVMNIVVYRRSRSHKCECGRSEGQTTHWHVTGSVDQASESINPLSILMN